MGKIPQGILGAVSGQVGNVIGASWKGIAYLRSKPASVANPRTEGQVNQRNKFAAVGKFLRNVQPFVRVGFKAFASGQTPANAAMAYNLRNGVTGTAPDFAVDYPNALVSRGSLTGVSNGQASTDGTAVTVSWNNNSDEGNARPDDVPMILIYDPAKEQAVSVIEADIRRDTGSHAVNLGASYTGSSLQVYLAFRSADGRSVSNSQHLGELLHQ